METIEFTHHVTGKKITGYGWDNFAKNYNIHTMNQTKERDSVHFIGNNITNLPELQNHLSSLSEKKVQTPVVEVKPEPKKVTGSAVKKLFRK